MFFNHILLFEALDSLSGSYYGHAIPGLDRLAPSPRPGCSGLPPTSPAVGGCCRSPDSGFGFLE